MQGLGEMASSVRNFIVRRARIPNEPNRLHHIFGQVKHNWHKTGLSQRDNIRLVEQIANEPGKLTRTQNLPGGSKIHTYVDTISGNIVEVRVFEDASGARRVSDAWVK